MTTHFFEKSSLFASGMPTAAGSLAPFVSDHILRFLSNSNDTSNPISLPAVIAQSCIVAMLDLSGYTTLTRQLLEEAEQTGEAHNASQNIGRMVKHFLDPLFELVVSSGGDIVKFGGDSITVMWTQSDSEVEKRAIQCCIDAALLVKRNPMVDHLGRALQVAVHAAIHRGTVYLIYVGDAPSQRIETVCHGQDYLCVCQLLNEAKRDEIIVTRTMDSRNLNHVEMEEDNEEFCRLKIIFDKMTSKEDKWNGLVQRQQMLEQCNNKLVDAFVDLSLPARLSSHYDDLSEVRQVTVSFIHLSYPTDQLDWQEELATMQRFAFDLQNCFITALEECEQSRLGLVRQVAVDDKGLTILMLFGMPPATQENTSIPAASVTLRLMDLWNASSPFSVSVGLSTGRIYTGVIGTTTCGRLEHAVLGNAVNLAARLMMRQEATNKLLCDLQTRTKLPTRLVKLTRQKEPLKIKGWAEPVNVWTISANDGLFQANSIDSFNVLNESHVSLRPVKRKKLQFNDAQDDQVWRDKLNIWLNATSPEPTTFVIEGMSGTGKSQMANRIRTRLLQERVLVWDMTSFEIESGVAFHTMRSLGHLLVSTFSHEEKLQALLENEEARKMLQNSSCSKEKQLQFVVNAIANYSGLSAAYIQTTFTKLKTIVGSSGGMVADLINTGKMSIGMTPSARTAQSEVLLQNLEQILVALFNTMSSVLPMAITFDDCQWQDAFSWSLTHSIVQKCPKTLVILISRPPREYVDPSLKIIYETLIQYPSSTRLAVGQITPARISILLNQLFPELLPTAPAVKQLAESIHQKSGGNAFAIDVLLNYLAEKEQWDPSALDKGDASAILPRDMNDVFVSQLERVDARFRLLLRTAALIGQVFYMDELVQLCEIQDVKLEQLIDTIRSWDKFEFLELIDPATHRWQFRHCLIVYQIVCLSTSDERKPRHKQIAEFYAKLLKTGTKRNELLPLVHMQYVKAGCETEAFWFGCKLVSFYYKLEMYFDARSYFLEHVEPSPILKTLPEIKRLKYYSCGIESAALCMDAVTVSRLFTTVLTMLGVRVPKCKLAKVFLFLKENTANNKFWSKGVLQPTRIPEERIERRLSILRLLIIRCSQLLDVGAGKNDLDYVLGVINMYNLHCVYRNELPAAKILEVALINILSMGLFLALTPTLKAIEYTGLSTGTRENPGNDQCWKCINEAIRLNQTEAECDLARIGASIMMSNGFIRFLVRDTYNYVTVIHDYLLELSKNTSLVYNAAAVAFTEYCVLPNENRSILYARRLRQWLESNPNQPRFYNEIHNCYSQLLCILCYYYDNNFPDNETQADADFMFNSTCYYLHRESALSAFKQRSASFIFKYHLMRNEFQDALNCIQLEFLAHKKMDHLYDKCTVAFSILWWFPMSTSWHFNTKWRQLCPEPLRDQLDKEIVRLYKYCLKQCRLSFKYYPIAALQYISLQISHILLAILNPRSPPPVRLMDQVMQLSETNGATIVIASLHHLQMVLYAKKDKQRAEQHYKKALTIYQNAHYLWNVRQLKEMAKIEEIEVETE